MRCSPRKKKGSFYSLVHSFFPLLLFLGCGGASKPVLGIAEADLLDSVFLAPPVQWGGPFLVCFRFEVTRSEYLDEAQPEGSADLPASNLNRVEASYWSQARGLRLPTEEEWRHLRRAGGSQTPMAGNANTLELGLGRALPVGVFERSRTPLGGYDFDGNVWEWLAEDRGISLPGATSEKAVQIGGSFATFGASTSAATRLANELDRASDVGFRPVADALIWMHSKFELAWTNGSQDERKAFAMALSRWRPEIRRQLAQRSRSEYPGAAAFADFLEGKR